MVQESTFTIRVDDHLKEAFTEAARVSDRTGAQLVRDFMRDYVQTAREKAEYEAWFKAKVEAGLKAVQGGRILSNKEVYRIESDFEAKVEAAFGDMIASAAGETHDEGK